ncbi:MAG: diaminopimelate epimerase [Rhodospirillales bacterium]|nr:diaminopimelate epimerase [Rhodospirillales bacterium]
MDALPFVKMHGLGNDFVVLDARSTPLDLSAEQTRAIANRKLGVGCDQLIIIEPPRNNDAYAFMQIRNADGDEVEACGNATRCIAHLLMTETGQESLIVETVVGLLDCHAVNDGQITVDMGMARLDWQEIPLAQAMGTEQINLEVGPLANPVAVNVGNPHAVFFVEDVETIDLVQFGPQVENHPTFPERTNVEAVHLQQDGSLRMRVWERGVGITQACGTGACAALVAAARRGLTGRKAQVILDGGPLEIEWLENGHIQMTGPIAYSFEGTIDPSLLTDNG